MLWFKILLTMALLDTIISKWYIKKGNPKFTEVLNRPWYGTFAILLNIFFLIGLWIWT